MSYIIYNENCLEAMKRLEDNSVDSIVTDPPYGLSFMGKNGTMTCQALKFGLSACEC